MKYHQGVICTLFLCFSSYQLNVHASWLEKGLAIFSSEESSETVKLSAKGNTNVNSDFDLTTAFKEALQLGSENVVTQLGAKNGFNSDSAIHIPLPEQLKKIKKVLAKVGMANLVDDLELKLNRAAERATPQAKTLFVNSIKAMTFEDIKAIYAGPEDSATQYFKAKMGQPLTVKMRPIVQDSLAQVGAVQAYDKVLGEYANLPFMPDVKANLTEHVVEKGISGIFYYLAKEEIAIRKDPIKQTSKLLKQVFGVD